MNKLPKSNHMKALFNVFLLNLFNYQNTSFVVFLRKAFIVLSVFLYTGIFAQLNADWDKKMAISLSSDYIDDDLSNWTLVFDQTFSAVLTQNNGPLDADGTAPTLPNGDDLRFSSDVNGLNELALDIRDWTTNNDPTLATCEVAVKIPLVDKDAPTTIYMWWGNATASPYAAGDLFGQYNAYEDDYVFIYHLSNTTDRASNQFNGSTNGGVAFTQGILGDAASFDGNDDYIESNNTVDLLGASNDVTISVFVNPDVSQKVNADIFDYGHSTTISNFVIQQNNTATNEFYFAFYNGSSWEYSYSIPLSANTWQQITYVKNGTSLSSYLNDAETISSPAIVSPTINKTITKFRVGDITDLGLDRNFSGIVDEIRISNSARSEAWIKADYYNLFNTPGFLTISSIPDNSFTLSDPTITQGEIATIDQDGSEIGVSYQLRVEGSNVPVGDPVDGTGAPIQFQVVPQSSVSYNVLATNTTALSESVLTDIATVTVNSLPQVNITYGTPNTPIAFTEQSAISTSNAAFSITSADMNGDGHMDVIGSDFAGRIDIFQNNGDGSFTSQIIDNNAIGIFKVHIADVDSDGDNDVLAALGSSNEIKWYRNNGDNTYDDFTITTNVNNALSVYAIDMDYDGDMDVLSASQNDNKIAWYENDGNENFTQHEISTSAIQVYDVFATDMDNDGDIDVLGALYGGNRITWYKNNGDLSFQENVVSNTTDLPNSVYAYDMDGDGLLDVLAASFSDGALWYRNNGNETFQENLIGSGSPFLGTFRAIPFDMDLDGDTDVLCVGLGNEVFWFENTGGQVFVKQTVSTNVTNQVGIYASDLDWDGDLDIISASLGDSKIAWFENDLLTPQCPEAYIPFSETGGEAVGWSWSVDGPGTAVFNPNPNVQSPFIAGLMQGDIISVEVTASNGSTATARVLAPLHDLPQYDFELSDPTVCEGSIATIEQSGSEPTVVYQLRDDSDTPVGQPVTGTGGPIEFFATATAATSYNVWATDTITGCSIQLTDLSMVSISGDDAPIGTFALSDPVLCPGEITATIEQDGSEPNTTYQLRLNADNSPVGPSVAGTGGPIEFNAGAIKSALYNVLATSQVGDNCQVQLSDLSSVVVSPPINPDIVYGTPNRPPTFTDQLPLIDELSGTLYAVYGVDIDDDGDTDVLATEWGIGGQRNINLYKNDGAMTFTSSQVADADFDLIYDVLAVDMDDDGDMDIVGASQNDGVAWFENDGTGFSSPVPAQIIDPDGSFSVFTIDLNLDGDMDVLSADFTGDKVSWFENDGAEGFTSHIIAGSLADASHVFAADMDNDGDLDVLSTSRGSGFSGSVNLHRNDGSMGFSTEIVDANMLGANAVVAADIDNDGDNDIVAATRDGSGLIKWYENDGLGNFAIHLIEQGYWGIQKIFATDMDSDGHIDIVSANKSNGEVFWYRNDGNENFTRYVTSAAWEDVGTVFPADLDGDGDLDIIGGVRNGLSKPLFWQRSNLLEAQCPGDIQFSEVSGNAQGWLWSSDNVVVTFDDNTGQNPVVSGLDDGDKVEVEVTDINGCTQSTVVTMPIKPRPLIVVTNVIDPVVCGDDGTINLTISNLDNGQYTIDYDGDSFTNVDVLGGVASISAPAGVYNNLTVTPPNGCTSADGIDAIVREAGAPEIVSANGTNPASCGVDGSIEFSFNGVPPGTYTVDYLGGSFADVDVDASGNATIAAPAGEYQNLSITVGGCTSTDNLDVLLEDPVLAVDEFIVTDVLCAGESTGSITITVSNGVPDYTFVLGGDATQSVTQAGNSYTFGSLPAGSYTVDVTDNPGNNCAAPQQQATIVAPATAIQRVSRSKNNATCAYDSDGAITVQVSGGTGDYSFTLSGDANESVTQASGQYTFENLGVGAYTVNVQDANSCAISQQAFEITSFPTPVSNYSLTGTSICVGEIATIAMGGSESTANYQLRLESNNTPVGPLVPGTGNPIDLTASPTFTTEYNVLAIDKFSGCEAELSNRVTVSVNELPAAIISYGTLMSLLPLPNRWP
jgi:hypothetical protein